MPRAGGDGAEKGRAGGKEQKREVSRGRKGRGSRAAPIWNRHHLRVGGKEKKAGEPGIRRRPSSATTNPASRLRPCSGLLICDRESCLPPATVLGSSQPPPAPSSIRVCIDVFPYPCSVLPPNPPVLFPLLYCFSSPSSSTLFLSTRALLLSAICSAIRNR